VADVPHRLMVDTGYWYAICDATEPSHNAAVTGFAAFERHGLILPWPCLYETLRTRFVKKPGAMQRFAAISGRPNVDRLDDLPYRDAALEQTLRTARRRPMSLVDMVMRLMLEDVNVRVNGFLTFNRKDFHDVCRARDLEML
jgi:predicted nucleic acid-binding protein